MRSLFHIAREPLGSALAAVLALGLTVAAAQPAYAAPGVPANATAPDNETLISVGKGRMVRLPGAMTDLFVANDAIADVQVRSSTQLYIFGKGPGETTVYATNKAGQVVFSTNVRVGGNFDGVNGMLRTAMPDSVITVTPMNGAVLLTGTVASPGDVAEASTLVQAFVGDTTKVISRVKSATPLQVNLRVKIVEVNRDFMKAVGVNLLSRDSSGGFLFGIGQGNAGTIDTVTGAADPVTGLAPITTSGYTFNRKVGATSLGFAGKFLGLDLLGTLDLAEDDGVVTTLAEPNLTALSGETASFLAGGEIPIPVPQYEGVTTIEYKQYGVSLAFTPIVLSDGRISMRVRPEVSQLTASTVTIGGYNIPGLTTRRAETTVELGSGQSFVIGGLLSNTVNNTVTKAPFLGDIPILGMLFKSSNYRRQETELVIVVTPYLVKPVSASQIATPADGFKAPTDAERLITGQTYTGVSGAKPPRPTNGGSRTAAPATTPEGSATPAPGFSF
jgi:pilus assembly protein CpaC